MSDLEHRIASLPRWVQDHIRGLQVRVERDGKTIARLSERLEKEETRTEELIDVIRRLAPVSDLARETERRYLEGEL